MSAFGARWRAGGPLALGNGAGQHGAPPPAGRHQLALSGTRALTRCCCRVVHRFATGANLFNSDALIQEFYAKEAPNAVRAGRVCRMCCCRRCQAPARLCVVAAACCVVFFVLVICASARRSGSSNLRVQQQGCDGSIKRRSPAELER